MCTAFAASDVQILKGTQLLPFLALAFWLRIGVGDIPAASSKCLDCLRFYDRKNPVSKPSKIKVCEIESLIRGQDKILSTKESVLENNSLFISFLGESIWYVGFCEGWYFGSSCFVTDWVFEFCCTQKKERGRIAPYQGKLLITGWVLTLMSCKPLSDARMSLLRFQVVRFRDNTRTSLENFATCCLFMLCRFPSSKFIMHWQRNQMKSFGQAWR